MSLPRQLDTNTVGLRCMTFENGAPTSDPVRKFGIEDWTKADVSP